MSKFETVEGMIDVTINPYLDKKANEMGKDITKKVSLYSKLTMNLKDLMNQMEIMSQKFQEVACTMNELSVTYKTSQVIENDQLNTGFEHLKNLFTQWSQGYQDQKKFFTFEMKYFFKFMQRELLEFTPVYNEYRNARGSYMDLKEKGDPKETETITRYYGFILNRGCQEYERLHKLQYKRLRRQFEHIEDNKNEFIVDYVNFMRMISFNI